MKLIVFQTKEAMIKKLVVISVLVVLILPMTAVCADINLEVLVDNRIADMGVPAHLQACVKREAMAELRRRGAIQTFILDLVIRKIIMSSEKYCKNTY